MTTSTAAPARNLETESGADIECRVEELLRRMTLDEKICLCHAGSKFAVSAIPRLGIPEFWMSDGPHGVRREICRDSWDPVETEEDRSTYLPTGTALAATWNPGLARSFGEVLGGEARHRGKDVILGPGINIVRTPLCGRNFEYYGEDPFHVAKMVVPAVEGIQSQQVAACVKHYAANSQELNRQGVDAELGERALREIYLPGFEAAVVRGKCLTVMGAYNRFRGQYCSHNQYLVNEILKGEWRFDGCFLSDWAAVEDTAQAAKYGLDLEMGTDKPYDDYYLARPFREAIDRGELRESLLDDKVRRNLRVMFRIGVFDRDRSQGERNTGRHHQIALSVAREAIVLLKNDHKVLPLDDQRLSRLVVIGHNAVARHASGGHSSGVKALYEVTPLEGLRNRLGKTVQLDYFQGYPPQAGHFECVDPELLGIADEKAGTRGWRASYGVDHPREERIGQADVAIDFDWSDSAAILGGASGTLSVDWVATFACPQSGVYEFVLVGARNASFLVDGVPLIHRFEDGIDTVFKSVELEETRTYEFKVELRAGSQAVRIKMGWIPPWNRRRREDDEELMAAARSADAVLFFGGLNHQYDLEGTDRRDMALHEGQNELIARVARENPRTAVVLVSGSPVEMPWVDEVPAIVQMWYAGMEAGHAIADVLLGNVNPSGKLPITFPVRLQDSPAHALNDYAPDVCRYEEGIFVGYRWFDSKEIVPLFPFGHGLSYTDFLLSDLCVEQRDEGVRVSLLVRNVGRRAGAEVVQIYVGQRGCSVPRPLRELKEFAKVVLEPSGSRRVQFDLPRSAFAYWGEDKREWVAESGEFLIEAGTSSRRIALRCPTSISFR